MTSRPLYSSPIVRSSALSLYVPPVGMQNSRVHGQSRWHADHPFSATMSRRLGRRAAFVRPLLHLQSHPFD
jgi:hypothetical protein